MARLPEIIRSTSISQVAATPKSTSSGWAAVADLAGVGADLTKGRAIEQAQEAGYNSVSRGADGKLTVQKRTPIGPLSDAANSAAYAKYLAQKQLDVGQNFTELAQKYEFDPAGFKAASDGYVKILNEDETAPAPLKEQLVQSAKEEGQRRFNGLHEAQTRRTYQDADNGTKAARDMVADDYVNLALGGDQEAADKKYAELEQMTRFRSDAPYIGETKEEGEAYLRGVRGSAKASVLTQQLYDLEGATQISTELRSDIEATLKDPDLSPDVRRKLYVATQGRLKGIDAAGIVSGLTDSGYAAKVVRTESGGNSSAKNPRSSATGLHQFIAGTWLENVRQLQRAGGASWANGLSSDEILQMRNNPGASGEVFDHFTRGNQKILERAGVPVNDATSYMAHFLGAGGAISILKADPSASVRSILGEGFAKANPAQANLTAGELRNWAERKMTVKASDIAAQQTAIDLIDDTEVRGMASQQLSDQFNIRKRQEDAAAATYTDRLASQDDTLTSQEVMQDHNLSDDAQRTITKELEKSRAAQEEVASTIRMMNDPNAKMDVYDPTQRGLVDKAYDSITGKDASSETGQIAAGEIAVRTGYLPKRAFNALRMGANSTDPAVLSKTMEYANQILSRQQGAISTHDGRSEVLKTLSDYRFYSGFMSGDEAAQKIIDMRSPDAVVARGNLSTAAKAAVKDLEPDDVVSHLSNKGFDAVLGDEGQQGEMMAAYERLFTDAFVSTGDVGVAKNRALDEVTRAYGPNGISGSSRIMKFPPQNFYPSVNGSQDYMKEQVVRLATRYAYPDQVEMPNDGLSGIETMFTLKVDPSRIIIMSDETTRQEIAAGKAPTYQIQYLDDENQLQFVPGHHGFTVPAPVDADPSIQANFEKARTREIARRAYVNEGVGPRPRNGPASNNSNVAPKPDINGN